MLHAALLTSRSAHVLCLPAGLCCLEPTQTAGLAAGLLVTSAALGFSARSLVAALSEWREEGEQPGSSAWQPSAAESSIGAWRTRQFSDESGAESSIASNAGALNLPAVGGPAVPGEIVQLSSPEKLWEAAWQGFEPPVVPAADSRRQPEVAEPRWSLLGLRSRKRDPARTDRYLRLVANSHMRGLA
jgi:hypothetical protein